jgi:hypothetical protein
MTQARAWMQKAATAGNENARSLVGEKLTEYPHTAFPLVDHLTLVFLRVPIDRILLVNHLRQIEAGQARELLPA